MRIVLVYAVLAIAVTALCLHLIVPLVMQLGDFWGRLLGAVITIGAVAPFLRALIMKKNHSEEFRALWRDSRFNHAPLISVILLRIVIAISFVVYIIKDLYQASVALVVAIAIVVVTGMIVSRFSRNSQLCWSGHLFRISARRICGRNFWERSVRNMPDLYWIGIFT